MTKGLKILSFLVGINIITACASFKNSANSTNTYLDSAKYNLSQNNASLALESANQAILYEPNNFEGYYLAAQSYQQLNDVNNADLNYSKSFQINKDPTNLYDFGLAYANFLCFYKLDYNTSQGIYNQSAILAIKNQSNGLMIADIYTSYANCLSIQNRNDEAINNYVLAMGYKDAPLGAYVGISKIYLKEHNYPSAYYYINLYKGNNSVDLLRIKIAALAGLLSTNNKLSNFRELSETLLDYKRQLSQLNNTGTIQQPQISESSKISTAFKAETVNHDNESTNLIESNVSKMKSEAPLDARVKAINGRKYITVEPQDTLYSLAKKSKVSLERLIQINHIHNNQIKIGEKLFLQ